MGLAHKKSPGACAPGLSGRHPNRLALIVKVSVIDQRDSLAAMP